MPEDDPYGQQFGVGSMFENDGAALRVQGTEAVKVVFVETEPVHQRQWGWGLSARDGPNASLTCRYKKEDWHEYGKSYGFRETTYQELEVNKEVLSHPGGIAGTRTGDVKTITGKHDHVSQRRKHRFAKTSYKARAWYDGGEERGRSFKRAKRRAMGTNGIVGDQEPQTEYLYYGIYAYGKLAIKLVSCHDNDPLTRNADILRDRTRALQPRLRTTRTAPKFATGLDARRIHGALHEVNEWSNGGEEVSIHMQRRRLRDREVRIRRGEWFGALHEPFKTAQDRSIRHTGIEITGTGPEDPYGKPPEEMTTHTTNAGLLHNPRGSFKVEHMVRRTSRPGLSVNGSYGNIEGTMSEDAGMEITISAMMMPILSRLTRITSPPVLRSTSMVPSIRDIAITHASIMCSVSVRDRGSGDTSKTGGVRGIVRIGWNVETSRERLCAAGEKELHLRHGHVQAGRANGCAMSVSVESHAAQEDENEIKHPRCLRRGVQAAEIGSQFVLPQPRGVILPKIFFQTPVASNGRNAYDVISHTASNAGQFIHGRPVRNGVGRQGVLQPDPEADELLSGETGQGRKHPYLKTRYGKNRNQVAGVHSFICRRPGTIGISKVWRRFELGRGHQGNIHTKHTTLARDSIREFRTDYPYATNQQKTDHGQFPYHRKSSKNRRRYTWGNYRTPRDRVKLEAMRRNNYELTGERIWVRKTRGNNYELTGERIWARKEGVARVAGVVTGTRRISERGSVGRGKQYKYEACSRAKSSSS
ncbi:hypothetical protein C8R47DRAFT_1084296 [Mycena vitilis]|nr:hypothetical protein C8R47DRAFT_1084296 [Mycena vitilis]